MQSMSENPTPDDLIKYLPSVSFKGGDKRQHIYALTLFCL